MGVLFITFKVLLATLNACIVVNALLAIIGLVLGQISFFENSFTRVL